MTKYVPKRLHFQPDGMEGRLQLAALDNNYNVGREQDMTMSGEARFKMQYSRLKGDYIAKKIYAEKSYDYVYKLMDDVALLAAGQLQLPPVMKRLSLCISRQDAPPKEEVVARLQSRLNKK